MAKKEANSRKSLIIKLLIVVFIIFIIGCATQEVSVPEEVLEKPEVIEEIPIEDVLEEPEEEILEELEPVEEEVPEEIIQRDNTGLGLTLHDGFTISEFTERGLGSLRFMAFSPDGILFVTMPSISGLYGIIPLGGKVLALPDLDKDGKADEVKTVISGLNNRPHGIAFYNGYLYITGEDKVSRYKYQNNGDIGKAEHVVNLPSGNSHVSRTIGFSPSGKMYVSVGSSCNVCKEPRRENAAILEFNDDGSNKKIFAEGLRNAVGFIFHPVTGEMWATENGRDWLGEDLPPEEINIVKEGKHYGWPYCYGKKIVDPKFNDANFCTNTEPSLWDMQAHSAPLGLRFIESKQFQEWEGDLIVAYHGSWNRKVPTGYKVVRLDIEGNKIVGEEDFISGWLKSGSKKGRPVDAIFDSEGALYISDDKLGVIYRITKIE
ncbi:MAG: sorbosone dehydrogenase family protein [Nanoarchaeota archaeon]|nr:sorbosone dehydrogenase family protein [Nanoarchaeota archaeon]